MNNHTRSEEELRHELNALGAREFEVVALTMDVDRGKAALDYAIAKNAENPIAYAIKVFDNAEWKPSGSLPRRATNLAAPATSCARCNGDRFVVYSARQPIQTPWMKERGIVPTDDPIEEMAPCPDCSPNINTGFFRSDGTRFVGPSESDVRDALQRS